MPLLICVFAFLAFGLAPTTALPSDSDSKPPQSEQAEIAAPSETGSEAVETDGAEEEVEEPPHIMDIPLDGSSVESFKKGLNQVDEQATEKEYRSLMSALDYLLFYELGVSGSRQKLYAHLDGKTPNGILQIVRQKRSRK